MSEFSSLWLSVLGAPPHTICRTRMSYGCGNGHRPSDPLSDPVFLFHELTPHSKIELMHPADVDEPEQTWRRYSGLVEHNRDPIPEVGGTPVAP